MSTISESRATLSSEEKRALLAQLLQEEVGKANTFPLSFAQQRLWFLHQLEPDSPVYNVPVAVRLTGQLNVIVLRQCLDEIIRRHEILRTTFVATDGQPMQVISPASTLPLPMVNLQELPKPEREAKARKLVREEAQRPFDLAKSPLLKATLLRLDEEEHILLIVVHHIVFDGWSKGIFIQELCTLYEAFSAGKPSPLPELPIQYADFAHWQRQWLQGDTVKAQLTYWIQQLANVPSVLELPTDRPRPSVQTSQGSSERFQLEPDLMEGLKMLSQQSGTTLFMTLLAVFATLLARYSSQEDIIVGSPIANRNRREIEPLIGFFVNTLVLRADLSGKPSFLDLLERVRRMALEAYAHQDVPFEKLVEALQPERHLSHTPLFQVMFALQNAPMAALVLPGLTLRPMEVESGTAKFDLTLSMSESEQGLTGELEYNADLFDAATMTRMAGHFRTLLESAVVNPKQRLSELPLLTESERRQLLIEWNNTGTDYPQDQCVHQLFEAQVEQTPDAVAVAFENPDRDQGRGQQLTYRELNHRANQLAHHLRALGVGPEVPVGICVERSLEMIVGLLGILKAGGAYVPLDPTGPPKRLAFILADSQVSVLLTQERLVTSLPTHAAETVCLDAGWPVITQRSAENLVSRVAADNLAYVIYTSGSTGKPKGTMIQHGSLASYTETACAAYEIGPNDRILQFTSISFDTSAEEVYPCLARGAMLVLRTDAMLVSASAFMQKCQDWAITVLDLPTSYWHELATRLGIETLGFPPSLRLVIIGGERALPERLVAWQRCVDSRVRLVNTYGPTEATIVATMAELSEPSKANATIPEVPIGRAIRNVQVYILDQSLQPVPIGVPGELHISGVGLARGYLNHPEATAEKFIPNPFSDQSGTRLYKTGDLARYRSDGNIEFIGRIDDQVKVRGFRIELGEIEAALSQHPAVQKVVVLAREDTPGDKRLVAYVVPSAKFQVLREYPDSALTRDLHHFLQTRLPNYMLPSAFVLLEPQDLPLTHSGKVDRRALPAPDTTRPALDQIFVAPRDSLELKLTQVWEDLLNIRPIGVTDSFFDLGGHSLLVVRLMTKIQKLFGRSLPLATIFRGATVEHLASILRQQNAWLPQSPLVAIQPGGSKRPFFCVHAGSGTVLYYASLARHLGLDQPFYGLQALGLNGEQCPYTRIEDMAAHYIEALRTVQSQGPYLLGGWCIGGTVAFEMAQQLRQQGQQVAMLALIDSSAPIPAAKPADVDQAALLAWFLLDLGDRFEKDLAIPVDELRPLEPDKQLSYALERAKLFSVGLADAELVQFQHIFEVYTANLQASRSYLPRPYPGHIVLFQAGQPMRDASSGNFRKHNINWGKSTSWQEFASEPIETYIIPGNHYTMLTKPNVQVLAEQLKRNLAQVGDNHN